MTTKEDVQALYDELVRGGHDIRAFSIDEPWVSFIDYGALGDPQVHEYDSLDNAAQALRAIRTLRTTVAESRGQESRGLSYQKNRTSQARFER